MNRSKRRIGVHSLVALAAAGLIHSTPGMAVAQLSPETAQQIQALEEESAKPAKKVEAEKKAAPEKKAEPPKASNKLIGQGEASYYGHELAGNRTASGERFNPHLLTAAHRTLRLGSKVRVTNTANGKSVVVRINDRGPFVKRRIIDVSLGAAQQLGMVRAGKAQVRLDLLN